MSFQTESVNNKFIKEFREEIRSLFEKFKNYSQQNEYVGSKRIFFNIAFDRYLEDLETNKEKLQWNFLYWY